MVLNGKFMAYYGYFHDKFLVLASKKLKTKEYTEIAVGKTDDGYKAVRVPFVFDYIDGRVIKKLHKELGGHYWAAKEFAREQWCADGGYCIEKHSAKAARVMTEKQTGIYWGNYVMFDRQYCNGHFSSASMCINGACFATCGFDAKKEDQPHVHIFRNIASYIDFKDISKQDMYKRLMWAFRCSCACYSGKALQKFKKIFEEEIKVGFDYESTEEELKAA